eukprot:g1793.t1
MQKDVKMLQKGDRIFGRYELVERLDRFPVFEEKKRNRSAASSRNLLMQIQPRPPVQKREIRAGRTQDLGASKVQTVTTRKEIQLERDSSGGPYVLGKGSFGVVWKGKVIDTDEYVALKIPLHYGSHAEVENEMKAMKEMEDCPNVVGLIDHFYARATTGRHGSGSKVLVLVLEFYTGGTIGDFVHDWFYFSAKYGKETRSLNDRVRSAMKKDGYWEKQKIFFRDLAPGLAAGLQCASEKGWIVRDFKSLNALVMEETATQPMYAAVSDLGLARKYKPSNSKPDFLSKPQVKGTPLTSTKFVNSKNEFSYRTPAYVNDNWSLGMTMLYATGFCSNEVGNKNCLQLGNDHRTYINNPKWMLTHFGCAKRGDNSSCGFWADFVTFLKGNIKISQDEEFQSILQCAPFSELLGTAEFSSAGKVSETNFFSWEKHNDRCRSLSMINDEDEEDPVEDDSDDDEAWKRQRQLLRGPSAREVLPTARVKLDLPPIHPSRPPKLNSNRNREKQPTGREIRAAARQEAFCPPNMEELLDSLENQIVKVAEIRFNQRGNYKKNEEDEIFYVRMAILHHIRRNQPDHEPLGNGEKTEEEKKMEECGVRRFLKEVERRVNLKKKKRNAINRPTPVEPRLPPMAEVALNRAKERAEQRMHRLQPRPPTKPKH